MKECERFLLLSKVCEQLTKMNHIISPEERQKIMSVEASDEWDGCRYEPDNEELENQS